MSPGAAAHTDFPTGMYEKCLATLPADAKDFKPYAYYFDSTGDGSCVALDRPYGKTPETLYSNSTQI